ncbi:hypothetical protein QJS10_CPB18g00737 [Acorus calamus]|uniref:Uncharacterized protein n=1 Tax=Acorus calamus TaxID=4465 RepID=A0AAV9CJM7_ACOCL|nr:hypothetical protein QJS10_CPB18g00737 [Acorus calamus]
MPPKRAPPLTSLPTNTSAANQSSLSDVTEGNEPTPEAIALQQICDEALTRAKRAERRVEELIRTIEVAQEENNRLRAERADFLSYVEGSIHLEDDVSSMVRKATTVVIVAPPRKDAHPSKKQSSAMSQKDQEKPVAITLQR